jgi:predicted RNase H-like HicB family nuclease
VVDVPELAGWMAHGATPPDAVAAAQETIQLWLDAVVAAGRPIPEAGLVQERGGQRSPARRVWW